MQRRILTLVMAVCWSLVLPIKLSFSQEQGPERKVVTKVMPAYPSLARTMHITGVVRMEAVVAPNGSLKTVEIRGGNPVLVQAATGAVSQWKWEPSSHETHESIEIKFDPQ
jgi:TonB family protein